MDPRTREEALDDLIGIFLAHLNDRVIEDYDEAYADFRLTLNALGVTNEEIGSRLG
jgi:hypothetical protein